MKPAFTDLIGNEHLRLLLRDEILSHRLSHAYILDGAKGIGKHTLALRIAAALACEAAENPTLSLPCLQCPSCKKILSGNSPDVITISREDKATLGVEAIRQLKNDVLIAPNDISAKIYIIEDAHLMTSQAQNALLLTLEEPPPYVLFLLLCERTETLLETIRSRAPILRLAPLSPEQIKNYLVEKTPEAKAMQKNAPHELEEISIVAGGCIGRALTLLEPKKYKPLLDRRNDARAFVRLCQGKNNSADVLRFLNNLSTKREELTEQCNEFLLCLRDLLLCKQSETAPLCFFANREEAYAMAYDFTSPTLLTLTSAVTNAVERLRMNANVRLTVMALTTECGLLHTV